MQPTLCIDCGRPLKSSKWVIENRRPLRCMHCSRIIEAREYKESHNGYHWNSVIPLQME